MQNLLQIKAIVNLSNLGYCYEKGVGVEVDFKKSLKYYKMSSEKGSALGMFNMGDAI